MFEDTTPLVEGLSIDEAFLDVRGLRHIVGHARSRSPRGCGATCASRSACRSPSASRARSSSPRSRAASRSRTGCSSCRPTASSRFLHPLPVERLWGVGPVTAAKLARPRDHDRRPGRAARARARWSAMLGRASGRHLHALAHNRDPRPVQVGRRRGRSARSARSAARRRSPPRSSRPRRARRPRHAPAARGRTRRAHRRPAAALRRLLARDALAHAAAADRARRATILATARGLLARRDADDRAPGPHAGRRRRRQPRRRRRHPAGAAFDPHGGGARRRARPGARAVRVGGRHARRAARPATRDGFDR